MHPLKTITSKPLSLCLGDGTKMMAADAHGKTLVGWWQFDDIAGYDSSGGGYESSTNSRTCVVEMVPVLCLMVKMVLPCHTQKLCNQG